MTVTQEREKIARDAIKRAFGTDEGRDNIGLFIEHHLAELPMSYWRQYLPTASPEPYEIINLLQFRSSWGEADIEYFDFTLPDDVTDYVISIHFNDAGVIDTISMES
jgi:Protein of unknown function (DUF2004)